MRIVRRKEFLTLPENTLFAEFKPLHLVDGLRVKLNTYAPYEEHGGDFLYQSIELSLSSIGGDWTDSLFKAMGDSKLSLEMDFNSAGRDGMGESEQYYVVYEAKDLAGIIELLQSCLEAAPKN